MSDPRHPSPTHSSSEATAQSPDESPHPTLEQALTDAVTASRVHVAVVSGRDLTTLRALTGIETEEPITLIGSHGAESSSAAAREVGGGTPGSR